MILRLIREFIFFLRRGLSLEALNKVSFRAEAPEGVSLSHEAPNQLAELLEVKSRVTKCRSRATKVSSRGTKNCRRKAKTHVREVKTSRVFESAAVPSTPVAGPVTPAAKPQICCTNPEGYQNPIAR